MFDFSLDNSEKKIKNNKNIFIYLKNQIKIYVIYYLGK